MWPTPPVSGALYLSDTQGTVLLSSRRFPIPALGSGTQLTMVAKLTPPTSGKDFYRATAEADSDGILNEWNENNNRVTMTIPVVVTTTLTPAAVGVLTSASGRTAFLFPAGTVTTATEIRVTPLWLPDLPPGPPLGVSAFRLTARQGGRSVSLTLPLPITVTWRYTNTDVTGLDEDALHLYRLTTGDRWQRMFCPTEQRQPDVNRLNTCIQRLGEYIFGQGYERYLPSIIWPSSAPDSISTTSGLWTALRSGSIPRLAPRPLRRHPLRGDNGNGRRRMHEQQ